MNHFENLRIYPVYGEGLIAMISHLSEVLFKRNSNYQIGKYCALIGRKFLLIKFFGNKVVPAVLLANWALRTGV